MQIQLHKTYPAQIKNPEGVLLAVKVLPCGLPKEGPKPASFAAPLAIVYASNLFDNDGRDVAHWDWYSFPCADSKTSIDDYVKGADLTPNQWYFLDIFDGEENEQPN